MDACRQNMATRQRRERHFSYVRDIIQSPGHEGHSISSCAPRCVSWMARLDDHKSPLLGKRHNDDSIGSPVHLTILQRIDDSPSARLMASQIYIISCGSSYIAGSVNCCCGIEPKSTGAMVGMAGMDMSSWARPRRKPPVDSG